jgi:2-succinyl-6-hydroxy-2,4-cyclohexadiene-1-carboxylate synthase
LVLAHGFTQTRRSWLPLVERWADRFEVVTVDLPGHGGSADVAADLVRGAALLGAAGGRATYVGYSMGGRHALRLAVDRPDLVRRLVLVSTSPGIRDDEERRRRAEADAALADHLEEVGVDEFLREWLAQPLFATLPPSAAALDDRRRNTVAGLAASLRFAGSGAQVPLWDGLAQLDMPVLLVVGALDTKFASIAEEMCLSIGGNATVRSIPAAGHTAHLERPAVVADTIEAWLDANDG